MTPMPLADLLILSGVGALGFLIAGWLLGFSHGYTRAHLAALRATALRATETSNEPRPTAPPRVQICPDQEDEHDD